MSFGPPLPAEEVALFESQVVPRYYSFFGAVAVPMLLPHPTAAVAHLGCRTGYLDMDIADRLGGCSLVGVDSSPAAVEAAQRRAANVTNLAANYHVLSAIPTPLPADTFTHALAVHPLCAAEERGRLLAEMRRLVVPGGQVVLSVPLRGSFPEINDMLREYALRQDLPEVGKAVDAAAASRPTIETVVEEFETAGLVDVDVDVQLIAVSFANGKDFLDDPINRLVVTPDTEAVVQADAAHLEIGLRYVRDAISKYWSEGVFELTVNVGCASGRRG